MNRILTGLLIAPLLAGIFYTPAFAQKTKAQLTTEIGTTYPDNTVGAITPSGVRTYETDVINSIMPTAPVVSGNLACFNGTTGLLQDCGSAPTTVPLTVGVTPVNSAVNGQVLYANGLLLGQYTPTQLTAQISLANASSSGALPAWPNNTTTFFRGDGSYSGLNYAALPTISADNVLGNPTGGAATPQGVSIGNCSNALTYNTTTHAFGCNALAGTGTVTNIATAGLASGGPITSTGTITGNYPAKYWSGFQHTNDVGTPNTKVDIAAGVARDSTDAVNIIASSCIIDFGTTGANGLDTGSLTTNTLYYTFAITKAAGATPACLGSTSPSAPSLPATYTNFRRIGTVKTDGSSHILPFTQVNNYWYYNTSITDVSAVVFTANTYAARNLPSIPAVLGVVALGSVTAIPASGSSTISELSPGFMPSTASSAFRFESENNTVGIAYLMRVQVGVSAGIATINYKPLTVNHTVTVVVAGWIDDL